MAKWRCIVCGAEFESDTVPAPCEVCGAGEEAFEKIED